MPRTFVAPRTSLEKALASIWATVLQIEQVGIHDNFFALGGDSLLATGVLAHIHDILLLDVEVSRFFEAPTVAEMAQHLETLIHSGQARRLSSAIPRVPRQKGWMPASIAQERLCELQHALPDLPFLNILYALRLTSSLDVAVLERSINEIVRRHEILRTTFDVERRPSRAGHCTTVDRAPEVRGSACVARVQEGDSRTPAYSRRGASFLRPRARSPVARSLAAAGRAGTPLAHHHAPIICDGWSLGVLVEELTALYDAFSAGQQTPLAPLPIQYADFARWQRQWRSYPEIDAQLAYWREQLHDPLPVMKLASARSETDHRRSCAPRGGRWHCRRGWRRRSNALAKKKAAPCSWRSSPRSKCCCISTWARTTCAWPRWSPIATDRGASTLIGPLANTVILRTDLGGDPTPREVMRRVRATALAAFAHQELPFEELRRDARARAWPQACGAWLNVMIWLQNSALRPIASLRTQARFRGGQSESCCCRW